MSIQVNIEKLSNETREKINTDLTIEIEKGKYNTMGPKKFLQPYSLVNNNTTVVLPFAYGVRELKCERRTREEFPAIDVKFTGVLRDEQKIVKKEAIDILKTGSVIISAFPGFGKTLMAINLSSVIKLKTLIIVNKIVLIKQWEESITKFCPDALVQRVTPQTTKKEAHFYIINAINVPKMNKKFFADIGNLIIDEAHLILAETLSKSFQCISPRYLIGLSATPFRYDGMNCLFDLYFGKDKIIREMIRKHNVYKVMTGFTPEVKKTSIGKINWGDILDSQSKNEERNELIVRIVKYFKDRNFLILVKRVEQGNFLLKRMTEEGEDATDLIGSKQEFNKDARILIGTLQKVGTGFDHDKLDALLLATDLEAYFIQILGRVFRKKDTEPIVFDLVDNNPILKKHFQTRKETYEEHGGRMFDFKKSFPDF